MLGSGNNSRSEHIYKKCVTHRLNGESCLFSSIQIQSWLLDHNLPLVNTCTGVWPEGLFFCAQSQCPAAEAFRGNDLDSHFRWGSCLIRADCGHHFVFPCRTVPCWLDSQPHLIGRIVVSIVSCLRDSEFYRLVSRVTSFSASVQILVACLVSTFSFSFFTSRNIKYKISINISKISNCGRVWVNPDLLFSLDCIILWIVSESAFP